MGSEKSPALNISPLDFADFLVNLPGGLYPDPDFDEILGTLSPDFDPGRFYLRNITT